MSHEPQGRIAEPPRQPYRSSSGRTWPRWWWLAMVVSVAGMLFLMGFGAHDNYEYRSGTPVQATIIDCDPHAKGGGADCTARWNDESQSHTGRLHRVADPLPAGSLVDVRVTGDDAYAATSGTKELVAGAAGIGVFVVLSALYLLERRFAERRRR